MLLRGSSIFEEKAIKLLAEYDYNFDLAKFHILNPTQMMIKDRRDYYLNTFAEDKALLNKIVTQSVIDLKGCKQHEIE